MHPPAAESVHVLHHRFLTAILPKVETHARIAFRRIRCTDTQEDCVEEAVAISWKWFVRTAFFCPACGHNSAQTTFAAAVQTVRATVTNLPGIRSAVAAAADDDSAENTARQLLENGLVKLVASFQRFAEAAFLVLPNASSFQVRKNLFQNLNESTALWRNATGKGYEDFLTLPEMADLHLYFQQRHLLAHREGLVDQDYLTKSGDRSYAVGQKLVIKEPPVLRLAELVEKLAKGLTELAVPPPAQGSS